MLTAFGFDSLGIDMTQTTVGLEQLQQWLGTARTPPLDKWQPTQIADFPITITENGDWYHQGRKIERQALVALFASVLWGQDGNYFLKTPSHLYRIDVEDAPVLVIQVDKISHNSMTAIAFGTNTHGVVLLDEYHQPYFENYHNADQLYLPMRHGLKAKFSASALYQLIALGELTESDDKIILSLDSLNKSYQLTAPSTI